MIDVGTGLAVLGIGGPITAAIIKFVPSRLKGNGNGYVSKELCNEKHKHADQRFDEIMAILARIEGKVDHAQR